MQEESTIGLPFTLPAGLGSTTWHVSFLTMGQMLKREIMLFGHRCIKDLEETLQRLLTYSLNMEPKNIGMPRAHDLCYTRLHIAVWSQ